MLDIKLILQRTNIQELRSLLLEGINLSDNGNAPEQYLPRSCFSWIGLAADERK